MRPDNNFGAAATPTEVRGESFQCLGHVPVAQVPRRDLLEEHGAVILFRVFYETGVLLGVERLFFRSLTIAARIFPGAAPELGKLPDHFILARFCDTGTGEETVHLRILAKMVETGIPFTRPLGRIGVYFFEIPQHGLH